MKLPFRYNKWHLVYKIIPYLVALFLIKVLFRKYGLEFINLNALFTSLIAGTIFLISFLINGVISDYKESEKIPGDMASSLALIYDEAYIFHKNKQSQLSVKFLDFYKDFLQSVILWFYRKERTNNMIEKLFVMNDFISEFENEITPGSLTRIKNEQNSLRKFIIRIDYIRDTSFIQSAYAIVEVLAFFMISGLLILKGESFYESIFFTLLVSFLIMYMIMLIKDLDNPFDYSQHGENGTEVSLKPIHDLIRKVFNK